MSSSAGCSLSGPYMSSSCMCRIGKRTSYSRRKTVARGAAASTRTISCPVWGLPSKPQCETVSRRRFQSCTGQPGLQKRGVSCARSGFDSPWIEWRYRSPPEDDEGFPWLDDVQARGIWVSGDQLAPPRRAHTVRVRGGKAMVTDGPFAETKEAVGGFDLIECGSLEEAVEIAASHPIAELGAIEVRPLWGN